MLWHHQVCLSRPLADLNLGLGCCPGGSGETYLLGPCRLQASLRGLCQKHKVPLTLSQRNTAVSTSTGIWTMYNGARPLMRPWDPQATAQPVTHQRLSLGHLSPEDPLTWFMATPPLPAHVRRHLLFRNMVYSLERLLLLALGILSPPGELSTTVAQGDAGCHQVSHAPGVLEGSVNSAALQPMERVPCDPRA